MFSKEDFLLPNGEPMSALEIAEMLNSWENAPSKKANLPSCIVDTGMTQGYPIKKRQSSATFYPAAADLYDRLSYHLPITQADTKIVVYPVYTGVDDYINSAAAEAFSKGIQSSISVGLTLDLLLSLEYKMGNYSMPIYHEPGGLLFGTPYGGVNIYLIEGTENVQVIYDTNCKEFVT